MNVEERRAKKTAASRTRRGNQPIYIGPCSDGCGRPARKRSALCESCYHKRLYRLKGKGSRSAGHQPGPIQTLEGILAVGMPVDAVTAIVRSLETRSVVERRIVEALVRLLEGVQDGRVSLRRPQRSRRDAREALSA